MYLQGPVHCSICAFTPSDGILMRFSILKRSMSLSFPGLEYARQGYQTTRGNVRTKRPSQGVSKA